MYPLTVCSCSLLFTLSQHKLLCSLVMKGWPSWCTKPILWEVNSFRMLTRSFVPINLHRSLLHVSKNSVLANPLVGKVAHQEMDQNYKKFGYRQTREDHISGF